MAKGVAVVGREGPIPSDETRSAGGRETRSQQSGQLLYGRSYLIGESLMAIAPIPIIGCLLNRPTLEHMPTIPKPGLSLGHFPYSVVNLPPLRPNFLCSTGTISYADSRRFCLDAWFQTAPSQVVSPVLHSSDFLDPSLLALEPKQNRNWPT